jgi:hypothetical protein
MIPYGVILTHFKGEKCSQNYGISNLKSVEKSKDV